MATEPALILIGFGNGDGTQITVEAEAHLRRHGVAYCLNAPPALVRYLKARNVALEPLDELLVNDRDWPDRLLDVADVVLRQSELEPPVCLLIPDNPLFMNPLGRFLVGELRERRAGVTVLPGVSRFDIVINELGLDVGRRGLAILDAAQAIEEWPMPTTSPALVFQLAALAPEDLQRLAGQLRSKYPGTHNVTLVNVGFGDHVTTRATFPLSRFDEGIPYVSSGSCLFVPPATAPRRSRRPDPNSHGVNPSRG